LLAFLEKKTEKNKPERLLRKDSMVKQIPGGTAKKHLIYHISKNNHHSKKWFLAFYSSSQGLSNDIIFTSDFTKNDSTFW